MVRARVKEGATVRILFEVHGNEILDVFIYPDSIKIECGISGKMDVEAFLEYTTLQLGELYGLIDRGVCRRMRKAFRAMGRGDMAVVSRINDPTSRVKLEDLCAA